MNTFTETQRLSGWWIWATIGVCFLIAGSAFLIGPPSAGWIILILVSLVTLSIRAGRLDTRYDRQGVHFRMSLVADWHTIRWTEMAKWSVTTYPYAGIGIRWNFGERVYSMGGNWGLRIITTTGKRIVIGTQRPDELRAFLTTLPTLTTT